MAIEILDLHHIQLLYNYYNRNKAHLEKWEPKRSKNYYTLKYFENKVKDSIESIKEGNSMHFVLLDQTNEQIIGVCNYTKIIDSECWLGYSITKGIEGKGFMYEALIETNDYIFNTLKIRSINAGILPKNQKSRKLLKRLSFKDVGTKDNFLEINGILETHTIYTLNKIDPSNKSKYCLNN